MSVIIECVNVSDGSYTMAYGFSNEIICWIEHFLSKRIQSVYKNGAKSSPEKVTSGIPQGSVLGPVFFVMYINDLSDHILSNLYMFADDTKIFRKQKTEYDHKCLQNDLENFENSSKKWTLSFHPDKCFHMYLEVIQEMKPAVTSWLAKHIGKSVCEMFAIIRRIFRHLNENICIRLYKSLFHTHLDYANSVYSYHKLKHIDQIETVHRRAPKQVPGLGHLTYSD